MGMKDGFFNMKISKNIKFAILRSAAQADINDRKELQNKIICNPIFDNSLTAMQTGLKKLLNDNVTIYDFQLMQQDDGKIIAIDVQLRDYKYGITPPTDLVHDLFNFCQQNHVDE